jgi:glucose-6-phosphate 1-dehydrogenase
VPGDVAVDCWSIVDPVLEAWRLDEVPLTEYGAGGQGPEVVVGWADGTL